MRDPGKVIGYALAGIISGCFAALLVALTVVAIRWLIGV